MFLLPKIHKRPPELDFKSSRSPAKSESWNNPSLQCCAVFLHMTVLTIVISVMNILNQPCKSFITCLTSCCDWSCQFVHGPQDIRSSNSWQVQAFQDNLWANFWQLSNWFQFLLFELMVVQTRMRNFVKLLHILVCPFTVSLIFEHVHPCRSEVFLPSQKNVIRTFLCTVQWWPHLVCIPVECIPNTRGQEMMWVRQYPRFFMNFFHIGAKFCCFPAILMSSTYTDRNKHCVRRTNIHSQIGIFTHPSSDKACSNCLSHGNPGNGWPCRGRTFPYVWQSGSVLQCYLSVRGCCISCLSVTTWSILQ